MDSNTIKRREKNKKLLGRKEIEGEKREQQQEEALDPYSMFVFAMKSQVTRRKYTGRFIKLLDFIGIPQGTIENRCKKIGSVSRFRQDPLHRLIGSQLFFLSSYLQVLIVQL
ncbi:MAG: hypothetical protein JO297_04065 [Nitrososphaeraceae archaeon]|nr:hypothetical protein [Nitrososphaeraceae archaeon]